MAERNPYHPLFPPSDPTLFFGREDAVAFLRQHLVGGHNREFLLILGRLGMGKSALLHQAPFIVDERYQSVYLDLQPEHVQSGQGLLQFITQSILQRMERIGASTYRVPELPAPETSLAGWQGWFADEFLDVVVTAIRRDRFLLLPLDNLHLFYDAIAAGQLPRQFFDYWAELLQRYERLDVVAALEMTHESQVFRHPLTANHSLHYRLAPLTLAAARHLITEPVAEEYYYSDEAVETLLHLAGGYPFLLHSICRLLYRYREGNKQLTLIGPQHIKAVYDAALEEAGEVMLPTWESLSPNERQVLLALLEMPQAKASADQLLAQLQARHFVLNSTQLASTLRSLEYIALIDNHLDGTFHFNTEMEADWLRKNASSAPQREAQRPKTRRHLLGVAAVLMVLIIIVAVLLSGVFERDESPGTEQDDAPPTLTLDAARATERGGGEE